MNKDLIRQDVEKALAEDLGDKPGIDITAQLIPADQQVEAKVITREACVMAGKAWVEETFRQLDETLELSWFAQDGDQLQAEQVMFEVKGNARSVLTGERTALNFLQTLSATATVTAHYVSLLHGTGIKLLDTRKTLPGLRMAQKYAVTCGGGHNHRIGLFDAFLIKENHIMACGSIANAVAQARKQASDKPVEVEVENLDELSQAIEAGADIVMLDNFDRQALQTAVEINQGKCKLEVSGNITEHKINQLRDFAVDYISSGALTKNVQAIDLSMRFIEKQGGF